MQIDIDKDFFIKDCEGMLSGVNIHGHINSRHKEQRKPVVSKMGKEVAKQMAEGIWAYLTAWEVKEKL